MVMGEFTQETDVLVIGGGPGGYAAAFRAADLGLGVTLVDTEKRPGGVCLFRGCIPSKTLLYLAELLHDAQRAPEWGITFGEPKIDLDKMRKWKDRVIDKLAKGLVSLSHQRGVELVQARVSFEGPDRVRLYDSESGLSHIKFRHAVIATGSHPIPLPGVEFKRGSRIMDSAQALDIEYVPQKLLIIGGGYVGVELGSVYASLGSRVTLVEMADRLLPGADPDLVKPLFDRLKRLFEEIHLHTRLKDVQEREDRVEVTLEGEVERSQQNFDRMLVAIGRRPNSEGLQLENASVNVDDSGFITVDAQRRTARKNIFAVGDVVGGVMLAHKALYEGKIAAEVIAGEPSAFDVRGIPAVVYTDPQLAWCGLTQEEAEKQGRPVKVARFPWTASGRAASMGLARGMTKLVIDPETERILGIGIIGREAGEMISEGVLAIEMGALAQDVALSIHPHPTLSEGEEEAASIFLGSSLHVLPQKG